MRKPIFIGIAGGTGSGKSTFTNRLKETFGDKVSVVYYDNYYKRRDELSFEERKKINYDHPDAFETEMLIDHIRKLRDGQAVECPVYDYTVHNRSDKTITIRPADVILVEGIMVLQNDELRSLLDIKVYVEADADERILRRVIRDVKERGRSLDSVISQYLSTVKPMHEAFVEPSKRRADVIVPEGGHNLVALDMVIQRVRAHLESEEA